MKLTASLLYFFVFLTFLTAGGSSENGSANSNGSVPEWFKDLDSAYPDADYVAVVGDGDTKREATDNAREELSKRFKVSVSTSTVGITRYKSLSGNKGNSDNLEIDIETKTMTLSNETFSNIKFSNTYTDKKGKVSVVAYLVRKEASDQYRRLIGEDKKLIDGFKDRVGKSTSSIIKFALADSALIVAQHSQGLIDQLDIINPNLAKTLSRDFDTSILLAERDKIAAQVKIQVLIEGDSDGKVSAITTKLLNEYKLSTSKKADAQVTGKIAYDNDAARKSDRKGVRWSLNLSLMDENGQELCSMFQENLEEAISDKEAMGFAIIEVEKAIKKDFAEKINEYLSKAALGR